MLLRISFLYSLPQYALKGSVRVQARTRPPQLSSAQFADTGAQVGGSTEVQTGCRGLDHMTPHRGALNIVVQYTRPLSVNLFAVHDEETCKQFSATQLAVHKDLCLNHVERKCLPLAPPRVRIRRSSFPNLMLSRLRAGDGCLLRQPLVSRNQRDIRRGVVRLGVLLWFGVDARSRKHLPICVWLQLKGANAVLCQRT